MDAKLANKMKKLLLSFLLLPGLLLSGCSNSEDEPETHVSANISLGGFVSDYEGVEEVETLYIGRTYRLNLFPYCAVFPQEPKPDDGFVTYVSYYLNDTRIASANTFPFFVNYKPNIEPGKYKLAIKPTYSSEYIEGELIEKEIVISELPVEKPANTVTGVSIKVVSTGNEGNFIREKLLIEKELIVSPVITPANAKNQNVIIASSNNEVASIELTNDEYHIIPNGVGVAVITVTTEEGNYTATLEVEVSEIDAFVNLGLSVGTEGNSITGFYSYVRGKFLLNEVTQIPLSIKQIMITNESGDVMLKTEEAIEFRYGQSVYTTNSIITASGLQTYPAHGWKIEAVYTWNGKEYSVSYTNP